MASLFEEIGGLPVKIDATTTNQRRTTTSIVTVRP